jgi:predicted amidophosphoribosyltransferase
MDAGASRPLSPHPRAALTKFRGAWSQATKLALDVALPEEIANPPAHARARAAIRYDDMARTLAHALKYQDRTDLAPAMGRWMARAGGELLDDADALVTVPQHWR